MRVSSPTAPCIDTNITYFRTDNLTNTIPEERDAEIVDLTIPLADGDACCGGVTDCENSAILAYNKAVRGLRVVFSGSPGVSSTEDNRRRSYARFWNYVFLKPREMIHCLSRRVLLGEPSRPRSRCTILGNIRDRGSYGRCRLSKKDYRFPR